MILKFSTVGLHGESHYLTICTTNETYKTETEDYNPRGDNTARPGFIHLDNADYSKVLQELDFNCYNYANEINPAAPAAQNRITPLNGEQAMNNNIAGFDSQGFLNYLKQNFSGFENNYLYSLVENILESSANYMSGTDELLEYFKAIFPEIEFGEIAIFVEDDYLTDEGKKQKRIYRAAYEADELWERQRDIESGRDSEYQNMTEFFNNEFPRTCGKHYTSAQIHQLLCWVAELGQHTTRDNVQTLQEIINN